MQSAKLRASDRLGIARRCRTLVRAYVHREDALADFAFFFPSIRVYTLLSLSLPPFSLSLSTAPYRICTPYLPQYALAKISCGRKSGARSGKNCSCELHEFRCGPRASFPFVWSRRSNTTAVPATAAARAFYIYRVKVVEELRYFLHVLGNSFPRLYYRR